MEIAAIYKIILKITGMSKKLVLIKINQQSGTISIPRLIVRTANK
jgi:hypothetical protein